MQCIPALTRGAWLTHGLDGVGVLCHHAEGTLEGVVDLVHVLVQALVVEELVKEVVPSVLQHQAAKQLCQQDVPNGGKVRGGPP